MARPERNNVDYFPFYCEEGKKMYYIEETYGNDGFAVFIKILRELAKTDFHFLDLSKNTTLMFLSAKCKVEKETLENIINDLSELGKFDTVLWKENKIIWCQDFIDSIQDAYLRRKNNCITYEGLLLHLSSLGIHKPDKSRPKGNKNPQIKEYKTKEEEIKETGKYVCKFHKHLSIDKEKYEKLVSDYGSEIVNDKIDRIDNRSQSKNYKDLNMTLRSWLKDEKKINSQSSNETQKRAFV